MNQDELHKEHIKLAQLGWNEIQAKCIRESIKLHMQYLKEELERNHEK